MTAKDYVDSIKCFRDLVEKQVDSVNDVILRGTTPSENDIVPGWSDVDFSIIVEKITPKILNQINLIYQKLKIMFDFKISITVVTQDDINNKFHHHLNLLQSPHMYLM